eukprot:TRINITY_DN9102_c3_g1_i2.p1 TRINITY_DN9102_c3_g1~~TRINITY_DN9102_c3_g1_i2.p1  ORF type:complete len:705 (+),score=310.74 TRINITY_DN9102_c3_g1_i2:67-2181(+)
MPPRAANGAGGAAFKRKRVNGGPDSDEYAARKQRARTLREVARELPIAGAQEGILQLVRDNQCMVLIGETGSGKTTQVPQYLLRELGKGGGVVGITQPRRIAAITIARRVSEEMGVQLGGLVGYAVRFDDNTSHKTKIKYMTDGILMRELLTTKDLPEYSCIVLDEAHERTVNSDVLLGLIKQLSRRRKDLKIIIMSATLNADTFSRFWGNCPVGYVEGRTFPVDVFYAAEPVQDIVDGAVTTVLQIHTDHRQDDGDILVFLTGQDTIEDSARVLEDKITLLSKQDKKLIVVPLYANLSYERQARAFVPPPNGARKVILSTNVAETSLTIPNIRYVVDCGLVKEKRYNPRTGMDSLTEVEVSKAQAKQRAGRAGRVTSGECYRMFTEEAYHGLNDTTEPEIRRVNLASVVLQLKLLGVDDPMGFDFIDPPQTQHLVAALHLLYLLKALDSNGKVTALGKVLGKYPLDPTYAKTLVTAEEYHVADEVMSILSMLSVENVLTNPSKAERDVAEKKRQAFASPHGDHLTLLNMCRDYAKQKTPQARADWCKALFVNPRKMAQVLDVRKQLKETAKDVNKAAKKQQQNGAKKKKSEEDGADEPTTDTQAAASLVIDESVAIRKAFCAGFFLNVAQYDVDKKVYVTAESRQEVALHPTSVLFRARHHPPLLLFNELVYTKKRYMRDVVAIDENWLIEAAPGRWRRRQQG